jgi:AraC-like DNA-binding protein
MHGSPPCRDTISRVTSGPADAQRLRDLARLRRVRDRMDREYQQPLDVEALARGVHMSAGHLSREFKLAYGESPYSYLMTRRIERAMALLRMGELKGHLRLDPAGHPRPRRDVREGAGERCGGRAGADRSAVRDPRLRVPRPGRQPDPHPGALRARPESGGTGAFAVLASRPAARSSQTVQQLLLGAADAPFPCRLLLRFLDPADELVASERSDVGPGGECVCVGDQRLAQICRQLVHDAGRDAWAAHNEHGNNPRRPDSSLRFPMILVR